MYNLFSFNELSVWWSFVWRLIVRTNEKGGTLKFHTFPAADKKLLQKWLVALRRRNFNPSKYSDICSEHFLESDYYPFSRELKKNSVPSTFKFPDHLQNIKKERKPSKKRTRDECEDAMRIKCQKTSNSDSENRAEVCSPGSSTKEALKLQLAEQKAKIKVLQQIARRKEKQLTKLKSILHGMKKKHLISLGNVKVAVQILSSSVADAIEFLMIIHYSRERRLQFNSCVEKIESLTC